MVKNTYSACNTLYCLWEKKEQEPFEEFSMWKVLNALSTNRPEQIKELLQPQLQQQSDINDQLNSTQMVIKTLQITVWKLWL